MILDGYIVGVMGLTKREQRVAWTIVLLLVIGWVTRHYRGTHPSAARAAAPVAIQPDKP